MRYSPSPFVRTVREKLVPVLVAVTCALAMTAPLGSVTPPTSVVVVWACNQDAKRRLIIVSVTLVALVNVTLMLSPGSFHNRHVALHRRSGRGIVNRGNVNK